MPECNFTRNGFLFREQIFWSSITLWSMNFLFTGISCSSVHLTSFDSHLSQGRLGLKSKSSDQGSKPMKLSTLRCSELSNDTPAPRVGLLVTNIEASSVLSDFTCASDDLGTINHHAIQYSPEKEHMSIQRTGFGSEGHIAGLLSPGHQENLRPAWNWVIWNKSPTNSQ